MRMRMMVSFLSVRRHLLPLARARYRTLTMQSQSVRLFGTVAMPSTSVTLLSKPLPEPEDAHLKLHHRRDGQGFTNPWRSWREPSFSKIIWWAVVGKLTGQRKEPDTSTPKLTIHTPIFLPVRHTERLRATWLGHACHYVEFPRGLRVLFDPVFDQRCAPVQFIGPKRFTDIPCQIKDIPYVDAVVISHNHYDHMSHSTLTAIKKSFPHTHYFVPMALGSWFEREGFKNVHELDWWDSRQLRLNTEQDEEVEAVISCLPAQHSSARGISDRHQTLWASWSVRSGGKNLWFGGDTGYRSVPQLPAAEWDYGERYKHLPRCPAFSQIGELRGPFDLGLIPIGAYEPRYSMSPMHANPYDSVNIFVDTKCKRALGIHWGTWVLTEEEVLEPPQMLKQALKWKGLLEDGLFEVCDIGQTREY